ncbi:acetyltransferase AlgX (SGNH hydrolase-like protein) [Roseimicrobium gellanilyticum]|uniref:Acetyltransferase AlgX (SGNH hydrolase-like protein) n=1 Tax=Roseimicrobium gellanilyticum TaxID=748857 RepID=A0A366HPM0_9BACT|nr:hypothetical protein [Roseimicrobium gellanilyticum]RBP44471.1 acetyltransferase AlgX (SGNH hydrolase-like protein) [Roseimicrobium gellanilyticum]
MAADAPTSPRHVPDNPYPEEKETTVYAINRGFCAVIIVIFFALVLTPVVLDHLRRSSHEENGAAYAKRRAFWYEVFSPPSFDPNQPNPEKKKIVSHLRWLERGLDQADYAVAMRQNTQQWLIDKFAEGSQKVYIGWNGWLFYNADLKALTGYGPVKPEPFSVMKDPELAKLPTAAACITEFAAQLKERDIQLLFVPVPLKPMLYSSEVATSLEVKSITHPDAAKFYDSLRQQGVDVLDLTEDFVKFRNTPKNFYFLESTAANRDIARKSFEQTQEKEDAFLLQDTHWTPDAMRMAAEKVADHVKQKYPNAFRPMARTITSADGVYRDSMGDLVKLLDLKNPKSLFGEEEQFLRVVGDGTEDKYAPMVLLGDSFANIFDDPSIGFGDPDAPEKRIRAGFAQHLSLLLNQPLDVIAQNGKGATGVRREFARRHDDQVRGKKLVIWVIAARDVLLSRTAAHQANIEWDVVKFNPNKSPDALETSPVAATSSNIVVEASLSEKSANQDPVGTPYRDALHAAVYDVTSVGEGELAAKQIVGIQWTFKDKVMQPTASFTVGKKYKLTLVPWDGRKELHGLNLQDDTVAFDAPRFYVEKAEEVK